MTTAICLLVWFLSGLLVPFIIAPEDEFDALRNMP